MSHIGKKSIQIPVGVTVTVEDGLVRIRGPKGELTQSMPSGIAVAVESEKVSLQIMATTQSADAKLKGRLRKQQALHIVQWGTARALLANKIKGVTEGFEKKLEFEGVGYRAQVEGISALILNMGFTRPVRLEAPKGVTVSVNKNVITISGVEKELVGQFAAQVRNVRKVEPYKGKGIKYQGEQFIRKAGKKVVATTK